MRRSVALGIGIAAAFLTVALVVGQLVVPPLATHRVEQRLTADGGSAHVSLHAFPALRLLFHEGDSIAITGDGLRVPLGTGKDKVFSTLDGFGAARIDLTNVAAGPFVASRFTLERPAGAHDYELTVRASFTPAALAEYLGSQTAGGLGGLLGGIAGGAFPGGSVAVPVSVDARLVSESGNPRIVSGAGTVAGLPIGPLLEAVAVAIVARV